MLEHRGPDDRHCLITQGSAWNIGLCATRLAIRDTSVRGRMPMVGPTGAALVFNGELYNADDLRGELRGCGRRFVSSSDTEVVLAALEAWGDDALTRFNGIFALAFHDRACSRLMLARDQLGVKPLYYSRDKQGGLTFASEVRALISVQPEDPSISVDGLVGYLALGSTPEPGTIIEGVRLLEPGTALSFAATGQQTLRRWWSVEEQFATTERLSRAEAVDRVGEVLRVAVRRQLVSDVPIGLFLSGGVDSSALVGLAAEAGITPRTVSIVFAEEQWSEKPWIDAVVARHETEHQEVQLSADDFCRALPSALAAMDQPTFDGVNTYVVSRVAHEAGLTVALSGLGGDELFAGYELFRTAPRLEQIRRWMPSLPQAVAMLAGRVAADRGDRGRKLGRWLAGEFDTAYELQREVLDPRTRAAVAGGGKLPAQSTCTVAGDPVNTLSLQELTKYMRNVLLRDTDVMSMAHGLEVRVPLLDVDVVTQVARLPGALKLERGREKGLLVDAVGDLLPPQVARRPKMGFTLPFESWMRGALHARVDDALRDARFGGQVAEQLDPTAVAGVWEQFERGRTSWTRPWALYVAKVWGEHNLSGTRRRPAGTSVPSVTVRPARSAG